MLDTTMMNQENGLDQWMSNKFCKFDDMIENGADLFRWSETRFIIVHTGHFLHPYQVDQQ